MLVIQSVPVFINLLMSPGIDSQPGGLVRQPHLSYRPSMTLHRRAESIPRNRFLGSLNVYKYGLSSGGTASSHHGPWIDPKGKTTGPDRSLALLGLSDSGKHDLSVL